MHKHNGIRLISNDVHLNKVKKWIECFLHELNIYEKVNCDDEIWRRYAERPMVSLLATGISRNDSHDSISILQEYAVYHEKKFLGRADLFIAYKDVAFVIECKYAEGKGGEKHWNAEINEKYYSGVLSQVRKYFLAEEAEHEHYKNLYLGSIVFKQISHTNLVKFNAHIDRSKTYKDMLSNSFYTLITSEPLKAKENWYSALEVAGRFEKIK